MHYILCMFLITFSLPVLGEEAIQPFWLEEVQKPKNLYDISMESVRKESVKTLSSNQLRLVENWGGKKSELKRESSFQFPELKSHDPLRDFIRKRQLQLYAFDENTPERGRIFLGRQNSPTKIPGFQNKSVGFIFTRNVGILDY